jgi:diamine N-acetyltransferase
MFRGDRIYLRTLTSDDIDLIMAWENNPINWKISNTTSPFSRKEIENFVNLKQDIFVHEQLRLLVCRIETNEIIGNIDLFDFEAQHNRVGVGLLIDKKFRNSGYGSDSLVLIEEYCKVILGIRNIFCNILTDNFASQKLFEKHEYIKLGIKKNWHLFQGQWFDEFFYQKEI